MLIIQSTVDYRALIKLAYILTLISIFIRIRNTLWIDCPRHACILIIHRNPPKGCTGNHRSDSRFLRRVRREELLSARMIDYSKYWTRVKLFI